MEAALRCYHAWAEVSVSYRRETLPEKSLKYWIYPEIKGLIDSKRIKAHFNSVPVRITPTHVTLRTGDAERDVPADFVLPLIGYEQDTTLFKLAGLELEGSCQAPLFDPHTMEASVPNIYVAGTSVGGTQDKFQVFIENCHVHVERIVAALTGRRASEGPMVYEEPES